MIIIEEGDWILCPLTKDDKDKPNVVAKVVSVKGNIIEIQLSKSTVTVPKADCRVIKHCEKEVAIKVESDKGGCLILLILWSLLMAALF